MGKKFGLAGKDELENAYVNMYALQCADLSNNLIDAFGEKNEERKKRLSLKLKETVWPNNLKYFEDRLASNKTGFLVGDGLTFADLQLFTTLYWLGKKKDETLKDFPNVFKLDESIRSNTRIAQWLATARKFSL